MEIDQLTAAIGCQVERLREARTQIGGDIEWYPYDILSNLTHIDAMLSGDNRDLDRLAQGLPVADIGAADGDLAFALEDLAGWDVDILDTPATNMNGLRGATALRDHLCSRVEIHDIDLDRQFTLPRERYGLVFFLGILYHLQNPYYALHQLASHATHCLLSTRVARFAGREHTSIAELPVAYLVGPYETNNDPTNYWILSPTGLERLAERAGWTILDRLNVGETVDSDPSTPERDERMFLLLQSATSQPSTTPVQPDPSPQLLCWPLDHYYSPVANSPLLSREPACSRVWPTSGPPPTPGLEWRSEQQVALVRDQLSRLTPISFPDEPTGDPRDYHAGNEMFSRLDAWALQSMLRHLRPRRVIEVGCGWSSLVTARVNREYFDGEIEFTCIEPYPPDFLSDGVEGISQLICSPVEEVPVERFLTLQDGDVLFIDSSHTVKTGGDVTFLLHDVLPRLAPGVAIHFHDIFLPSDYPQEWVYAGRSWNEQYALRCFLTFNSEFEIVLGVAWMSQFQQDVLAHALPDFSERYQGGGGSMWIRRVQRSSPA
jgi:tRNA (mo5U34)-methyltransferase